MELQNNVANLEYSIEDLNVEIDVQKKNAERLRDSLDMTRTVLENSMVEVKFDLPIFFQYYFYLIFFLGGDFFFSCVENNSFFCRIF